MKSLILTQNRDFFKSQKEDRQQSLSLLEHNIKTFCIKYKIYIKKIRVYSRYNIAFVKINFKKDTPMNKVFLAYWWKNSEINSPLEINNFFYTPLISDSKANIKLLLAFNCKTSKDVDIWWKSHSSIMTSYFREIKANEVKQNE
jgi:hypothetical protein